MGSSRAVLALCARFLASDLLHPVSEFPHPVRHFRNARAAGAVREADWHFRCRAGTRCVPSQNFGFRLRGSAPILAIWRPARVGSRVAVPLGAVVLSGKRSHGPNNGDFDRFRGRPAGGRAPAGPKLPETWSLADSRGSDVEAVPIGRIGHNSGDLAPCAGGLRGGYLVRGRGSGRGTLTWSK